MMRSFRIIRCFYILSVCLLLLSYVEANAQPPIPEDNSDLDAIENRVSAVSHFTYKCHEMHCAEFDCSAADQVYLAVVDARYYLKLMVHWLIKATMDFRTHYESVFEEGTIIRRNLARAEWALGVQKYLHRFGSALLDLASVSDALDEILKDKAKLDSITFSGMVNRLDNLYEALKDTESAVSSLTQSSIEGLTGYDKELRKTIAELPALVGIDPNSINDHKSTVSDVISIVQSYYKEGKDWRKALTKGGAGASVGQIVGRYLKAYSESKINERKEHIKTLVAELTATDAAQNQAFLSLQKAQARRFKAEDVLRSLERLVYGKREEGSLLKCLMDHCPSVDARLGYAPEMPEYVIPESLVTDRRKMTGDVQGYGDALRYLNERLPDLGSRLMNILEIVVNIRPRFPKEIGGVWHDEKGSVFSIRRDGEGVTFVAFGKRPYTGIYDEDKIALSFKPRSIDELGKGLPVRIGEQMLERGYTFHGHLEPLEGCRIKFVNYGDCIGWDEEEMVLYPIKKHCNETFHDLVQKR